VIFANATCFEDHMVKSISKTFNENLKVGTVVILTTKSLETDDTQFKRIGPFKKDMSWGPATVNIYIKL